MVVIVWRYRVKPGCEAAFEALYGAQGAWVALMRRDACWRSTRLLRDAETPGVYLTLDEWRAPGDFEAFRARHADDYAALDAAGDRLTESEERMGVFAALMSAPAGKLPA